MPRKVLHIPSKPKTPKDALRRTGTYWQAAIEEALDIHHVEKALTLAYQWWNAVSQSQSKHSGQVVFVAHEMNMSPTLSDALKEALLVDALPTRTRGLLNRLLHSKFWSLHWLDALGLFGQAGLQSAKLLELLKDFEHLEFSRDEVIIALKTAQEERLKKSNRSNRPMTWWKPSDCKSALARLQEGKEHKIGQNEHDNGNEEHDSEDTSQRADQGGSYEQTDKTVDEEDDSGVQAGGDDTGDEMDECTPAEQLLGGLNKFTAGKVGADAEDQNEDDEDDVEKSPRLASENGDDPVTPQGQQINKQRRYHPFPTSSTSPAVENGRGRLQPDLRDGSSESRHSTLSRLGLSISESLGAAGTNSDESLLSPCPYPSRSLIVENTTTTVNIDTTERNDDHSDANGTGDEESFNNLDFTQVNTPPPSRPQSPARMDATGPQRALSQKRRVEDVDPAADGTKKRRTDDPVVTATAIATAADVATHMQYIKLSLQDTAGDAQAEGSGAQQEHELTREHLDSWVATLRRCTQSKHTAIVQGDHYAHEAHAADAFATGKSTYLGIVEDDDLAPDDLAILLLRSRSGRIYTHSDNEAFRTTLLAVAAPATPHNANVKLRPLPSLITSGSATLATDGGQSQASDIIIQICATAGRLISSARSPTTPMLRDLWYDTISRVHASSSLPPDSKPVPRKDLLFDLAIVPAPLSQQQPPASPNSTTAGLDQLFNEHVLAHTARMKGAKSALEVIADNATAIANIAEAYSATSGQATGSDTREVLEEKLTTFRTHIDQLRRIEPDLIAVYEAKIQEKQNQLAALDATEIWNDIYATMEKVCGKADIFARKMTASIEEVHRGFRKWAVDALQKLGFEDNLDVDDSTCADDGGGN